MAALLGGGSLAAALGGGPEAASVAAAAAGTAADVAADVAAAPAQLAALDPALDPALNPVAAQPELEALLSPTSARVVPVVAASVAKPAPATVKAAEKPAIVKAAEKPATKPDAKPAKPAKPAAQPTVAAPVAERMASTVKAVATSKRQAALAVAKKQMGKPYRYGATGPSAFDCSGLVQYAYKQVGVSLPRTSAAQSKVGTKISREDLQPGDLVFFYSPISHVGIYVGDGKMLNAQRAGLPVKISEIQYFKFQFGRRI